MRAIAVVATLGLFVACGGGPTEPPPEVRGLILEIEGQAEIRAFVVESDGERYRFLIDAKRDYGFDLAHLREHRSQRLPVLVRSRVQDGDAYATAIDDA